MKIIFFLILSILCFESEAKSSQEMPKLNIDFNNINLKELGINPDFSKLDKDLLNPNIDVTSKLCNANQDPIEGQVKELMIVSDEKKEKYKFDESMIPKDATYIDGKLCYAKKTKNAKNIVEFKCYEGRDNEIIVCEENNLHTNTSCNKYNLTNCQLIDKNNIRNIYECNYASKNSCQALKNNSDCKQVSTECNVWNNLICLQWEQIYECRSALEKEEIECMEISNYEELKPEEIKDENFDQAVTSIAAFADMEENFDDNFKGLFKGEFKSCHKIITEFNHCCNDSGWGQNVKLAKCSSEEKQLGYMKTQGQCHLLAKSCSKNILGKCIEEKEKYCCYNSKLARVFQEKAHNQLAISWKSNNPCRALLIEKEIQNLNMNNIDLSEAFDEVTKNAVMPTETGVNGKITNRFKEFQDDNNKDYLKPYGEGQ